MNMQRLRPGPLHFPTFPMPDEGTSPSCSTNTTTWQAANGTGCMLTYGRPSVCPSVKINTQDALLLFNALRQYLWFEGTQGNGSGEMLWPNRHLIKVPNGDSADTTLQSREGKR